MRHIGIFILGSVKLGVIVTLVLLFLGSFISGNTVLSLFLTTGGLFASTIWGQIASGFCVAVAIGITTMAARKHSGLKGWLIKRIPKKVLGEPMVECELVPGGARLVGSLIRSENGWADVRQFNGWMLAITWAKWRFPAELVHPILDQNGAERTGLDLIMEIASFGGRNGNGNGKKSP